MTLHTNLSFETATGSIDYPFTNDYMFRAILQKDKQVLKALIAALLYLKKESIHDVVITNPIELGAAISDKDFIWDIRVNLNNAQLIDLEMQMSNESTGRNVPSATQQEALTSSIPGKNTKKCFRFTVLDS